VPGPQLLCAISRRSMQVQRRVDTPDFERHANHARSTRRPPARLRRRSCTGARFCRAGVTEERHVGGHRFARPPRFRFCARDHRCGARGCGSWTTSLLRLSSFRRTPTAWRRSASYFVFEASAANSLRPNAVPQFPSRPRRLPLGAPRSARLGGVARESLRRSASLGNELRLPLPTQHARGVKTWTRTVRAAALRRRVDGGSGRDGYTRLYCLVRRSRG